MATKTVSLSLEAYERLRAARRRPDESFSQVIVRGRWPEATITAGDFLSRCREQGSKLSAEELRRIEDLKRSDAPPGDKWTRT